MLEITKSLIAVPLVCAATAFAALGFAPEVSLGGDCRCYARQYDGELQLGVR